MLKHLTVIALLFVAAFAVIMPAHAQDECWARVVWSPQPDGLPVKAQPSYWGPDAQPHTSYNNGALVQVTAAMQNTATGEIWYAVPGGYLQAFSGWSTGVTEARIATECALVHTQARHVAIPDIGLNETIHTAPIVDRAHQIGQGVSWLDGTAWIDDTWARITLAGHTPGVFNRLSDLIPGNVVIVWDSVRVEVYTVEYQLYTDQFDVQWTQPTVDETLTLITCADEQRLIVHAKKAG